MTTNAMALAYRALYEWTYEHNRYNLAELRRSKINTLVLIDLACEDHNGDAA